MNPTKRQLLIRQLRSALRDLTSPSHFDYDSSLCFDIDETSFEYEEEQLEIQVSE